MGKLTEECRKLKSDNAIMDEELKKRIESNLKNESRVYTLNRRFKEIKTMGDNEILTLRNENGKLFSKISKLKSSLFDHKDRIKKVL